MSCFCEGFEKRASTWIRLERDGKVLYEDTTNGPVSRNFPTPKHKSVREVDGSADVDFDHHGLKALYNEVKQTTPKQFADRHNYGQRSKEDQKDDIEHATGMRKAFLDAVKQHL